MTMNDDDKHAALMLLEFVEWAFHQNSNLEDYLNKSIDIGLVMDVDDVLVFNPIYEQFRQKVMTQ